MTTKTITQAGTFSSAQYNYAGSGATLVNAGTVGVLTTPGVHGVYITGANDTLVNTGTVFGGGYSSGPTGAVLVNRAGATGDVVINQVGGVIKGGGTDGAGVSFYQSAGVVTNAGIISSSGGPAGGSANGVELRDGGTINNSGTISGGGVFIIGAEGVVVNSGTILGDSVYGGVYMKSYLSNAHETVTNLAGGLISANGAAYGIELKDQGGTIINAGTISGGIILAAGYTNRVVVDPAAVFAGTVDGGTAAESTLELGSGTIAVSTLSGFGSQFTNFGTLTFDAASDWLVPVAAASITATTINGFNRGDTINVTGFTATNTGTVGGGTSVTLTNSGGTNEVLHFGAPVSAFVITTGAGISGTDLTTICFCIDTQIGTPTGEVPVQALKPGDMVLTAHNGPRKVTWVGTGKVLATRGRRTVATPVIVRQGALADNVPYRDLHVTKAHSLYIDGMLIPVEFLVNHKTIVWDDQAQEVEIYHIELESHDVLIANGVPAETYRDDGNRWLFQNANSGWGLPPQEPCAPVLTGGPVVDAVWRHLLDRAGGRDLSPLTDDPDLHLIIDGARVEPCDRHERQYVFRLPSCPASVILASRHAAPAELGTARDPRSLGVALRRVTVQQGAKFMVFNGEDERLTAGFHDYEPSDRLRWTEGYAELPVEAFARFDKGALVTVYLGGSTQYPDYSDHAGRVAA
jgi:hypothetical protein